MRDEGIEMDKWVKKEKDKEAIAKGETTLKTEERTRIRELEADIEEKKRRKRK